MKTNFLNYTVIACLMLLSCQTEDLDSFIMESYSKKNITKTAKIQVCHFNSSNKSWEIITISESALNAHLNHGDNICSNSTFVPDDNFEQALIDLGYDFGALDDYVLTENIIDVTSLRVDNRDISNLTGIGDFKSLVFLGCDNNNLTSLNVSNNKNLTALNCYYNPLKNLNVTGATNLVALACYGHDLTNLDISNNLALERLICNGGQLENLDVSKNTALTYLSCNNTHLKNLDLTQNTALITLGCGWNDLTNLDVSNNNNLIDLFCSYNELESLNVKNGNNKNFNSFKVNNNPYLTCIEVDDVSWSAANWFEKDAIANYSDDCSF